MAIQRGIALSACSETTAGLTLGQGFQAGAQEQQQQQRARVYTHLHSRGRATPGSVGEGVHYGQDGRSWPGQQCSYGSRNASCFAARHR